MDSLDIIDIGFDNLPTTAFTSSSGVELLMNNNNNSEKRTTRLGTNAINTLDDELSSFSNNIQPEQQTNTGFFSGMSNTSAFNASSPTSTSNIGHDTKQCYNDSYKSSSGTEYTKLDTEIPTMSFNTTSSTDFNSTTKNARDQRRKKMKMLKDMDRWYEAGLIKQRSSHTVESSYDDVEDEYDSITDDKCRSASIKMQGEILKTVVGTLEWFNQAQNPFNINLDGWTETVSDNIGEQDDVFSQLHDRYKNRKPPPEISLLLSVVGSAIAIAASNRVLDGATPPDLESILKQHPSHSHHSHHSHNNNNNNNNHRQSDFSARDEPINMSHGPPPTPIETKNMGTVPKQQVPPQQKSFINRPDITQQPRYQSYNDNISQQSTPKTPILNQQQPGIELNKPAMYSSVSSSPSISRSEMRPEMNKPEMNKPEMRPEMNKPISVSTSNDIDIIKNNNNNVNNILFGLKPKINKHNDTETNSISSQLNINDSSIISLSAMDDLNSLQLPSKRSHNRRNKSNSNSDEGIITLDI